MGPIFARDVTDRLFRVAKAAGIAHQVEVLSGRSSTTADVAQISRAGVPTALLSLPLRYMHSGVEVVSLADIAATADLLAAFLLEIEGGALRA